LCGEKRILRKISFDTEMRNGFFSMIISDQTKKTERESKKKKEKTPSLGGGITIEAEKYRLLKTSFLSTKYHHEIHKGTKARWT